MTADDTYSIVNRCQVISERYEKLLVLRLVDLSHEILEAHSTLAEDTAFDAMWDVASRIAPKGLLLASRMPALAEWVSSGERLIRNGVYDRYPDAHPKRHLRDFSYLLASWALDLPDSSSGCIYPLGRRCIPARYGAAVVIAPAPSADPVRWTRTSNSVIRFDAAGGGVVEVPLHDVEAASASSKWQVRNRPNVNGVEVVTEADAYDRRSGYWEDPFRFPQEIARALRTLSAQELMFVRNLCRSVARTPPINASSAAGLTILQESEALQVPWIAGLLRVPHHAISGGDLILLAGKDLVERLLELFPLGEIERAESLAGDLRSSIVELAGRRVASRVSNGSTEEGMESLDDRWAPIIARVGDSPAAAALLAAIGEEGYAAVARNDVETASGVSASLTPPQGWNVGPLANSIVVKSRRNAAFSIDDFSILDIMICLSEAELTGLLSMTQAKTRPLTESEAFYTAAAAYVLTQYSLSVECLMDCIRFDADVEEYWHLLAFSFRHLGRTDLFGAVVFDNLRDLEVLRSLWISCGNVS